MLDVVFGQANDAGKVRTHNEDSMASFLPRSRQESRSRGWLFAVADGVGGHDFGEVASAVVVSTVTNRSGPSLCSDGLYGAMYPEDIARFVSQNKSAEYIANDLVAYAIEVDGSDNVTAQVIQVKSVEAMGMYRGRLYPLPTRV